MRGSGFQLQDKWERSVIVKRKTGAFVGTLLLALTVGWLIPSFAGAAALCPTIEEVSKAFEEVTKIQGDVLKVKKSPIPGICEVGLMVNGRKSILYIDSKSKYFLIGHVIDIKSGFDLTQQAMVDLNRLNPEEMRKLDSLTVFSIGHSGKTLYFVTDPKCPYCKEGEKTLKKLAAEGKVTVKFLFFPLSIHPGAEQSCISIICDHKNFKGLETEYTSKNQCREGIKRVKASMSFLTHMGIDSTPVYIFPDGRYHPGLLSEKRLLTRLGIAPESKAPQTGASNRVEPAAKQKQ